MKKGDALIVFSKKSVLALAAHLENQGVHCSVIYGSLPPATRREQVRRFLAKETEVVVSTDAIGMGLNLPIRQDRVCGDPQVRRGEQTHPEPGGDQADRRTGRALRPLRRGLCGCRGRCWT